MIAKILTAPLLALGLVMTTPVASAHADETSYLYTLENAGVGGGIATELAWGYAVCTDAAIGRTVQTSISNVYYYPDNHISWDQAGVVVIAALMFLC